MVCFSHTEPSLVELLDELHPVCVSWYNIGLQLHIPRTTLDRFKEMHQDSLHLMREMLKHWLDTAVDPHPTWEAVVTALRSPIVNKKRIAEQLESKYCTSIQHMNEECNRSTNMKENEGIAGWLTQSVLSRRREETSWV